MFKLFKNIHDSNVPQQVKPLRWLVLMRRKDMANPNVVQVATMSGSSMGSNMTGSAQTFFTYQVEN